MDGGGGQEDGGGGQEDGGDSRGMEEQEEMGRREVFIAERRGCQGFRDLADGR